MILALLLTTAGCADRDRATIGPTEAFTARAATIDRAWRAALTGPAGDAWHTGLVPLQDLTVAPQDLTAAQQTSVTAGWYTGGTSLPASTPARGRVHFPGGATMDVQLISAAAAYHQMRRGEPPCRPPGGTTASTGPSGPVGARAGHDCAVLTIVGARLGHTTLRTSRGPATLPAWLFTVRELPEPIARAAFDPAATTPVTYPAVPAPGRLTGVAGAVRITGAAGRRVDFTVAVGPCDRDTVGLLHETEATVVVAGRTIPATRPCDGSLTYEPVTVSLEDPLGGRPVFDALTGRPLTPR